MKLNPLSICKKRKVGFLPVHFSKVPIHNDSLLFDDDLTNWIENKLNGRYAIVSLPYVGESNKMTTKTFVAFEEPKELTYFMLAYPNLRRN
jgi:hypothetical protein